MTLIENYLTQVSALLPKEGRRDILAELRQSLEERVQALCEAGTPAQDAQIEVLARLGHPIKVAGQYHPRQYLIGPGIFPAYRFLLGRVLIALLALHLSVSLFLLPMLEVTLSFGDTIDHAIAVLGWGAFFITLGFISVEYTGETLKYFDRWNAASLQQASTRPLEFGDTAWNILVEGIFLLWWNDVLVFSPADAVHAAPIWNEVFWPANIVVGLLFLLHLSLIVRGYWSRGTLKSEILLNLGVLAILATLWSADLLIAESIHSSLAPEQISNFIRGAMLVIGLSTLWDIRKSLTPLLNGSDGTGGPSVSAP